VGGAYLPEELGGKTEREAIEGRRLLEAIPNASDSGDSEPKLHCTASNSEGKEPKLRPTQESSSGYAPNSSRKRRELRTIGVEALQDRPKSVEPVGNRRNSWQELWGLGYALSFELLRATLLISLVLVRLGAAGAECVGRWLDERELVGERKEGAFTDDFAEETDLVVNPTVRENLTDD
jgi:hypothetical protein